MAQLFHPQLSESNTQMLKCSGGTAIPNGSAFQARGGRAVFDTVKGRTFSDPAEWLLAVNNPLCWESQLNVSSAGRRVPVGTSKHLAVCQV